MYDTYAFMSQRTGYDFEDAMMEVLGSVADVTYASKEQDTKEGTDAFVNKVRTDFTLHFMGKAKTERVGTWRDFIIGIRTGNARTNFAEPVLVIGLSVDASFAQKYVIPRIKTEIGDVKAFVNEAQSMYWDWVDAHPEYDM